MENPRPRDLTHDFVLPTLLFMALGGMNWAVRGSKGYGGSAGCIFAGVLWGVAWWYIAREPAARQSRTYASGWVVLAMTLGIGLAGDRGWRQWSTFFDHQLQLDTAHRKFAEISPAYGFLWLFIAGMPWAGLGACFLAWCKRGDFLPPWQWALRIGSGFAMAYFGLFLFNQFPNVFLPLYTSLKSNYADLQANPNLGRLINDNRDAIMHLGFYLGFLLFEVARRDWRNVTLIATAGVLNGIGWSLFQNWMWAPHVWPKSDFHWWRAWETSGGISIGLAYGIAYYLVNRPTRVAASDEMPTNPRSQIGWLLIYLLMLAPLCYYLRENLPGWQGYVFAGMLLFFGIAYWRLNTSTADVPDKCDEDPTLERFGLYLALIIGLGVSVRNGFRGLTLIYPATFPGGDDYWTAAAWSVIGPLMLVGLAVEIVWSLMLPPRVNSRGDAFPHAYATLWVVLIVQNILAQCVAGPHSDWRQVLYGIYYALLFVISGVIVVHYRYVKSSSATGAGTHGFCED